MSLRALCLPLLLAPAALSAQTVVNILNPSFESSTATPGSTALFDTTINNWFMENHPTVTTAEVAQRYNAANMPVVPNGSQWANLAATASPNVPTAGIYQAIGTFSGNATYTFTSFTVSQRSNFAFVGVTVSLYAGNVTGANGSTLSGLGATLLDSFTITKATAFGVSNAALNYNVPEFTLGTNDLVTPSIGQTLWLRINSNGIGQHLVDNLSATVTPVPEPASFATLLGLGALAGTALRRRRRA
jgi:hypothetical protein